MYLVSYIKRVSDKWFHWWPLTNTQAKGYKKTFSVQHVTLYLWYWSRRILGSLATGCLGQLSSWSSFACTGSGTRTCHSARSGPRPWGGRRSRIVPTAGDRCPSSPAWWSWCPQCWPGFPCWTAPDTYRTDPHLWWGGGSSGWTGRVLGPF